MSRFKANIDVNEAASLLKKYPDTYPLFHGDNEVILYFSGDAKRVEFLSDLTGWKDPISFEKSEEGVFLLPLSLDPHARIQYLLIVDGEAVTDPRNSFKARHGLGEMSELAMPLYKRHPYLNGFLHGEEGSFDGLIRHVLPAGALPYEHEVFVSLPPDYNSHEEYPSVYFQDGPDYIRFGLAAESIHKLIKENKIESCIAVLVSPPNLHKGIKPDRSFEYGLNDDYVRFFCDELLPFIDDNYRTMESAGKRLVVGDSYGGLISAYIAFSRPELFGNAYSQSGYFSFRGDKMIQLFESADAKNIKLMLDIGIYEETVGADFLPAAEVDFTSANRRMKETLEKKNYNFKYKEYHDGHTWGNWRSGLIDAMIYFFGFKGDDE